MGTINKALKIKEIRRGLMYMAAVLVLIRIGSQIPVPGIDREYIKTWFESQSDALGFLGTFTGGSFEKMSVFALSITPYITSTIIMQLLTIAFPALEELSQDGEQGRKKITVATRCLTIGLSVGEALSMSLGFGNQGLIPDMSVLKVVTIVSVLTAGSAFLMWIGEQVSENGIGNGISFILVVNILSGMPHNFTSLFEQFVAGKTVAKAALSAAVIVGIVITTVVTVVILEGAVRNIPIRYSRKTAGQEFFNAEGTTIPLKVNTSGVIAVIFASSILSFPGMVSAFIGKTGTGTWWDKVLAVLNQANWFDPARPAYTAGYAVYAVLVIFFAYFYTSITFNPMLIADNLRKSGGVIPGVRPGLPTEKFLKDVLRYIIFIGAAGLLLIATIPMALSGIFNAGVAFGGTSVIIIVGVTIDTVRQIDAVLAMHNYRGFVTRRKGGRQ